MAKSGAASARVALSCTRLAADLQKTETLEAPKASSATGPRDGRQTNLGGANLTGLPLRDPHSACAAANQCVRAAL